MNTHPSGNAFPDGLPIDCTKNGRDRILDFRAPSLFANREMSWMLFNQRVLEEAADPSLHPLLERTKFISIFCSNLDEFFMIRVAGLENQYEAGIQKRTVDGLSPEEQLELIRSKALGQLDQVHRCLYGDILPSLADAGVRFVSFADLGGAERDALNRHFRREIYPVLTPLAFDTGHPFPFMSNLSLNLAVELEDKSNGTLKFARVKVPDSLPRLLRLNAIDGIDETIGEVSLLWIEELIENNLEQLFPNMRIIRAHRFRIIRDADIEIEEDEAGDLLKTIEKGVRSRRYGNVVRLDINPQMPSFVRELLTKNLEIESRNVYEIEGSLGLSSLIELLRLGRPDLKDEPYIPVKPFGEKGKGDLFSAISKKDLLLHHPYDSFQPVVEFIEQAATDPTVLSIKQTLYRVGSNSPIVSALMKAAEHGKQVAVLVELKARFDEENNIVWARALEDVGAHVVYGLPGLKTHAKLTMIVRRESGGLKRYLHLGTGNYNPSTGKLYTDYSLFTDDRDLGEEAAELFNALTGYSRYTAYRHLLVSPINTRERLIGMIEREAALNDRGQAGHVIMKMNSLVDPATIRALYKASCAGVRIDLVVRGICCLKPGIPEVSDNIRVVSIIGRFLEHSRVYFFANGGSPELYLGSADIMPRNLDERVETLFPVFDRSLIERVREELRLQLGDNVKSWRIQPDGSCSRIENGSPEVNSQERLMKRAGNKEKPSGIMGN
ncbi:MAG: polyphosphate kinase 1 [Chlorobiaceae bacterium]|nr:polyphosphate kinase 1 [Chlorobiaceae bacterium]NTW73557.1 polyphosphate kinase 1 [Chlorobiaceae bacterium]